ncbi:MAG: hypothetical protein ED557_01425 [Balneola sp.]|nr:MAG: hypothetical protein ED557_01425 [Balneola sp.]
MSWIKYVVIDILALLIISLFCFTNSTGLEITIWIYTGILLLGRILFLFVDLIKTKSTKKKVPIWFYHVIYFLSSLILFICQNYYLGSAWILIWALSSIEHLKKIKQDSNA